MDNHTLLKAAMRQSAHRLTAKPLTFGAGAELEP